MKSAISILHITDLHIGNLLPASYETKIDHAVSAVIGSIDSTQLFIVISGDVANSGSAEEYDKANQFLSVFLGAIRAKYEGSIELIMVPGNHDINKPPKSIPENRGESGRAEQLAKMDDFFCFSLCRDIEWSDREVLVQDYPLSSSAGFSGVRFCCLNTAPFSTETFDKGVHELSHEAFSELRKSSPQELSVVVAHHGPEWFDDAPRLEFETEGSLSIDLLLVGHEHRGGTVLHCQPNRGDLPIFRGGTFSLSDEKECTFTNINIGPLQEGSYQVEETRYRWDSSSRLFTDSSKNNLSLEIKVLAPKPSRTYLEQLPEEINQGVDFFAKSFSFPRLRSSMSLLPNKDDLVSRQTVTIECADDFFSYLEEWDCVEIIGSGGAGKSCLARYIYIECTRRGYVPILIHPNNSTPAFSKALDALVNEQYGKYPAEATSFWQAAREKRVIIADDFDRIKKKKEGEPERLIRQMLESFGKVIITMSAGHDAVFRALSEGDAREYTSCGTLDLCACTKQVRDPLVTKLCHAADLDAKSTERMIRAVDRAVRGHAGLFELTPAFVTQYVNYFLANRAEMLSQDELPFKHIFDSNIHRGMMEAARGRMREQWDSQLIDAAFAALQDVALRMHTYKKSVVDVHEASEVISSYSEKHDVELEPRDVLDIAERSQILIKLENGFSYMFSSLYVHAYFVAKRIDTALDLGEDDIARQIDTMLDEICFTVNEMIIVFLTQLRLSVDFPARLLERARRVVGSDVPQGQFDTRVHKSLRPLLNLNVSAIDEEKAGKLSTIEDQFEDDGRIRFEGIEYADYYDNDTSELDAPLMRAFAAIKYVELAAGYLVKQFAKMPQEPKRDIRDALFQIPQIAADVVISDIDCHFDELATSIARTLSNEMQDGKDTESIAQRFIAASSLGISYGFMAAVFAHASEGRAMVKYLFEVEGDSFGYDLGRLFSLYFSGESERFAKLAVSTAMQAREKGHHIELTIIKILVNEYLHDRIQINLSDKHKLLRGVFDLPGDSSSVALRLRGR